MSQSGHLARLAVHPYAQRHHIAHGLVRQMLARFGRMGTHRVTVNTQSDNAASLALYRSMGFKLTGNTFPVYLV